MEPEENKAVEVSGISKLAAALAKAQGEFHNPEKNRTVTINHKSGGKHTYSYATLDCVLDSVRGPLAKNDLSIVQLVTMIDGVNVLITKLLHSSGQMLEAKYALPSGCSVQEYGAAITYARRYQICPMLGICGETDTDAEELEFAKNEELVKKDEEAVQRLKALAGKGQLTSAHTGKKLTPSDIEPDKVAVKAAPEQSKKEEPKPEVKKEEVKDKEDNLDMSPSTPVIVIDKRLQDVMDKSGIKPEDFKKWCVAKGHIPETMQMDKLDGKFIDAVIKQWEKVEKAIKGVK